MNIPVLSKLFAAANVNPKKLLAKMAGDHGKVIAEKELYDRLMKSKLGEKIKRLPNEKKSVFLLLNYFFSGIIEQKINAGDSFWGTAFKNMLDDSASEIAKRTINGAPPEPASPSDTEDSRLILIEMLLQMAPEEAAVIINRLAEMPESERKILMKELALIKSAENFANLSKLDEKTFSDLGKIFQPKKSAFSAEKNLKAVNNALKRYINSEKGG